jgi:hypothetical protein
MRHLVAQIILALPVWFVSAGNAAEEPKVTLQATLDAAQEVPPPSGTLPGAGGTASFEYDETDKSITYTVDVTNLTGLPTQAHIHQAPPGTAGPVRVVLDQNNLAGGASPASVPDDLVGPLYDGGTYVNVHTAQNPSGEVRGQIQLKAGTCTCTGNHSALRLCVKQVIKTLDKSQRASGVIRALKRYVKKSSCGRTSGPKKAVACCTRQPAGNIVTDALCLAVPESGCMRLGGVSLGGGSSCFPTSPCEPFPVTTTTVASAASTTSTTMTSPTCRALGESCSANTQCCSGSCYLGRCY